MILKFIFLFFVFDLTTGQNRQQLTYANVNNYALSYPSNPSQSNVNPTNQNSIRDYVAPTPPRPSNQDMSAGSSRIPTRQNQNFQNPQNNPSVSNNPVQPLRTPAPPRDYVSMIPTRQPSLQDFPALPVNNNPVQPLRSPAPPRDYVSMIPTRQPSLQDFPALPGRVEPTQSTLNSVWSTQPTQPPFRTPPVPNQNSRIPLSPNNPRPQNSPSNYPTYRPHNSPSNYPNSRPQNSPSNYPNSRPQNSHPTSPNLNNLDEPELATDAEITEVTEALLTKDVNNPFKYMTVNIQGRTQSSSLGDDAPLPLLTINETAVFAIPTIAKMRVLYNNYEIDSFVNEHVTPNEKREENEFIDAIMATSVMRRAMLFLQDKGKVTLDPKTHRDLLKATWFNMYSRGGGKIGSSAFEHIFLSEKKNGAVSGLHNWLYFYEEEKLGHIDYKGYIKKFDIGNKGMVMKVRFSLDNIIKPVNSMFIGTSPELDMAIYLICFELRSDRECPISLAGKTFNMKTNTFRYRGKNLIGSAYAEI